jgi:hypothetical protein
MVSLPTEIIPAVLTLTVIILPAYGVEAFAFLFANRRMIKKTTTCRTVAEQRTER